MHFKSLKSWVPTKSIVIPQTGISGKHVCLFFFGENTTFLETYNFLNLPPSQVRYVYVPTITKPAASWMTNDLRNTYKSHELVPIWSLLGNYEKLDNKNFFFDTSPYLEAVSTKFKFQRYNVGKAFNIIDSFIKTLEGIDSNKYDKVFLYSVNLDKAVPKTMLYKKLYPIYTKLLEWVKLPSSTISFDKFVLFIYDSTGGKYVKLFDKTDKTHDLSRFRSVLIKLSTTDDIADEQSNIDINSDLAEEESKKNPTLTGATDAIKSAVRSYLKTNPVTIDTTKELTSAKDIEHIAKRALVYNAVGDEVKARKIVKKIEELEPDHQNRVLNNYALQVLTKDKSVSAATHPIIKAANPSAMTDYEWPQHIFQKRYNDFSQNLKSDINDAFSTLKNKDIPLKVEKIKINKVETGPSEILKTIKDRYFVTLVDKNNEKHEVHIDIPHLTKNGTFLVNGQEKVLVNQLIRFPIFFPSVDVGRFQSSFSVMKINSKALRQGAYFILFMGSYKFPLIMYLAYRYGLRVALEEYGIKYRIEKTKGGVA